MRCRPRRRWTNCCAKSDSSRTRLTSKLEAASLRRSLESRATPRSRPGSGARWLERRAWKERAAACRAHAARVHGARGAGVGRHRSRDPQHRLAGDCGCRTPRRPRGAVHASRRRSPPTTRRCCRSSSTRSRETATARVVARHRRAAAAHVAAPASRSHLAMPSPCCAIPNADSVVTVVEVPRHLSPDYVMRIDGGRLTPFLPDGARVTRRQDARPAYYRDGTGTRSGARRSRRFGGIYGRRLPAAAGRRDRIAEHRLTGGLGRSRAFARRTMMSSQLLGSWELGIGN